MRDTLVSASALLADAAEVIARGKDGKQELISAVTMVVTWLAQNIEPSNLLKSFITDVIQQIVESPDVGGAVEWSGQDVDEMYRHAQWANALIDEDLHVILDRCIKL